jgi:hypothetical protein
MFALAAGKARTGRALGNPVLRTEGRVTMIDGILAAAVLLGLALNATLGMVVGRPGRWIRAGLLRGTRGKGNLLCREVKPGAWFDSASTVQFRYSCIDWT